MEKIPTGNVNTKSGKISTGDMSGLLERLSPLCFKESLIDRFDRAQKLLCPEVPFFSFNRLSSRGCWSLKTNCLYTITVREIYICNLFLYKTSFFDVDYLIDGVTSLGSPIGLFGTFPNTFMSWNRNKFS